jgi:Surface lipoprotein assembly modifier
MSSTVSFRSALCAALLLPALAGTAFADVAKDKNRDKVDRTSEWSFEVSAGAKYDSNISVIEIDTVVPADDFAAVIQVAADYLLKMNPQTTLKIGYDFDQSLYSEFDEFNYQSHAGSAKLKYKFGTESDSSDVALNYRYTYSTLGGDGFMNIHRVSPTFGVYVSKPIYLLFEYIYADKDFIDITDRDATVHSGGVDGYYFIDGSKFMIIVGYQYDDSDANDEIFDYEAHNGKIKLVRRLDIAGLNSKVSVGYEHEARNYSSPDSSDIADVTRDDNRDKFKASVELPITDMFYALVEYQYRDFRSNLEAADYSENLVEVRVGAEF